MISETITLEGHIIDSNVLAGVFDDVHAFGADIEIVELHIGKSRADRSHALIEVRTTSREKMDVLLNRLGQHGALWTGAENAALVEADMDGALPEGFYVTTHQRTLVRHDGSWNEVLDQEMDCAIRFDQNTQSFRCIPIHTARKGDTIVRGHRGVKIVRFDRQQAQGVFAAIAPERSTERPKRAIIHDCAKQMNRIKRDDGGILLVGGPAIVHTGATEHVVRLIETGYIHTLFAGNALAAHDIEYALFGTSLGVYLDKATLADTGHEHHIRAINTIRRAGSIANAVRDGTIKTGILAACIRHDVKVVLAGSLRDDGPLPEVITDAVEARQAMREALRELQFVLMAATGLHSIATANLLPAWVPTVCVDISPAIIAKLRERGAFQTVGLVTDVEPFFRSLVQALDTIEAKTA